MLRRPRPGLRPTRASGRCGNHPPASARAGRSHSRRLRRAPAPAAAACMGAMFRRMVSRDKWAFPEAPPCRSSAALPAQRPRQQAALGSPAGRGLAPQRPPGCSGCRGRGTGTGSRPAQGALLGKRVSTSSRGPGVWRAAGYLPRGGLSLLAGAGATSWGYNSSCPAYEPDRSCLGAHPPRSRARRSRGGCRWS